MKTKRHIILVTLLLSGCSPTMMWTKPDFNDVQFAKDKYLCMRETGFTEPNMTQAMLGSAQAGLAAGHGYYYPYPQAQAQRQNASKQLFDVCVQAHGYRLEEVKGN